MLLDLSITELSAGLRQKKFSSEDLVRECYEVIERTNESINAFVTILDKEETLAKARELDKKRSTNASLVYGLPYVLKDSYVTRGVRTTASSNILKDFIPPFSATVHRKLEDAGAILIGKTNMDAWGHGATNENSDFGPVRNPWNTNHVAGGSSGGAAAAVATRMAVFAIGEDTGGSIRNPASWCNVTGLKVTYGRVSRFGCIAYASSFDTVGPMAKTAADCAAVLEVIAGRDPLDATSSPQPVDDYTNELQKDPKGLVLAVPKECMGNGLDPEVKKNIEKALSVYESLGVAVKEISMPSLEFGLPVYYLIAPSETSSNLGRYDGVRYGGGRTLFTKEGMRRIMIGTYALSAGYYDAYYKKAQQGRTLFIREYEKALSGCDAILMPVTPTQATKVGYTESDPLKNMLIDVYTVTQNPVGIPSLAVPCGFTKEGLPVGMQIMSKMFSESLLFRLAHAYQEKTDWHTKRPDVKK